MTAASCLWCRCSRNESWAVYVSWLCSGLQTNFAYLILVDCGSPRSCRSERAEGLHTFRNQGHCKAPHDDGTVVVVFASSRLRIFRPEVGVFSFGFSGEPGIFGVLMFCGNSGVVLRGSNFLPRLHIVLGILLRLVLPLSFKRASCASSVDVLKFVSHEVYR